MKNINLKTFTLIYLIIVTICVFFVMIFQSFISANIGLVVIIVFLAAIPVAILTLKIMLKIEMSKPFAKLHKEFMDELWTNGFTQKFIDLGNQAIEAKKNGENIDLAYLTDFVFYLSDFYNLTEQFEKSLPILSVIDEKDMISRSTKMLVGGYYIVMFYALQMEAYRGIKNKEMAQQLIEKGRPYLDKKYKLDAISMVADTVVYDYYMLFENYEMAKRAVDKLMSYKSQQADKFYTKYFAAAEINMVLGNREEAKAIMEQCKRNMGEKLAVANQSFEIFNRRLTTL